MSTVSTTTLRDATEAVNALEAGGIGVEAVEFDEKRDTFSILIESGGRVGTKGFGGGTEKSIDPDGPKTLDDS